MIIKPSRLVIPKYLVKWPCLQVTWFFEDEPITASAELQIETAESFTCLRIENAKRWHCGEFRVLAENSHGEDAASVLVTVTCESRLQNAFKKS